MDFLNKLGKPKATLVKEDGNQPSLEDMENDQEWPRNAKEDQTDEITQERQGNVEGVQGDRKVISSTNL